MTNKCDHIRDIISQSAQRQPTAAALSDAAGYQLSYDALQKAITEAAEALQMAGVCAGDRVALISENGVATAVSIFAVCSIDAIVVPINARMNAHEISRILEHANPKSVIYTTELSQAASAHATAQSAEPHAFSFGTVAMLTHAINDPEPVENTGNDTAVLLYTSGTTGHPKGVMLSHDNLLYAAQASADLRKLAPSEVVYGVLPLTHIFGLASALFASMMAGASVILEPRFDLERVFNAVSDTVTVFPAVPQMHAQLMRYCDENGVTRPVGKKLRYVSAGAAPLDPSWKKEAEAFYGLPLQNGYGMTECTAGITSTRNELGSGDTSVGTALAGLEIKIDHAVGVDKGTETGEVMTRGPNVMKGYFRNPEETAKVIDKDGFLRTGDLGYIDADGNLHIAGRSKELIIRGGFNVYPVEVETAINEHTAVAQTAVVGRKTASHDEEVLAFVQCQDPSAVSAAELAAFAAERLTAYKRPARIIICTALPVATNGKVLKHKLLAHFAAEIEATEMS